MGISHQADDPLIMISRQYAPISFSDKRMKEECGPFRDHDSGGLSPGHDYFHVTGTQMGWPAESAALDQSSSAELAALNCTQEVSMDSDSAFPIRIMQALQFADSATGQDSAGPFQAPYVHRFASAKLKNNSDHHSKLGLNPAAQFQPQAIFAADHHQQHWTAGNIMTDLNLKNGDDNNNIHHHNNNNNNSCNYNRYYEEKANGIGAHEQDPGWPMLGVSIAKGLGNLGACHDANCMEQLLVHCASALESNDVTLAQQIMWVLNNIASAEGDPNQRVTSCFLRALIARAVKMGSPNLLKAMSSGTPSVLGEYTKRLSVIELAGFVDLTPWHRFGFSAANGAIAEAVEGHAAVHILDFGITHCMQWPTLIDTLSKRPEGAPFIRLTVNNSCTRPPVPPLLDMSYEEVGLRLSNFARSRNVHFEFRVIPATADSSDPHHEEQYHDLMLLEHLNPSVLDLREDEALVVNCQIRLHYIPDETAADHRHSPRDEFLRIIRGFEPTIVTLVDEDSNLVSTSLVSRLKSAFNYLWIPFDALDTFLPRDSKQRQQYEGDVGSKIENIIACEGHQRIERLESKARWIQRMRKAHFQSIPFSDDTVAEVKTMLDEHAVGWGLKKEDEDLLLTWKGHNVVFATTWIPSPP